MSKAGDQHSLWKANKGGKRGTYILQNPVYEYIYKSLNLSTEDPISSESTTFSENLSDEDQTRSQHKGKKLEKCDISHSTLKKLLNETSVEREGSLLLESVQCVPDNVCDCEEIRDRLIIYSKKLDYGDSTVYLQKKDGDQHRTSEWHTLFIKRENHLRSAIDNFHFLFPLLCSGLKTLREVYISSVHLCHKHVTDLLSGVRSIHTLALNDVIATADDFCGCKNTGARFVWTKDTFIKVFKTSVAAENENPISEVGVLFHIDRAPNLVELTIDGFRHPNDVQKIINIVKFSSALRHLEMHNTTLQGAPGAKDLCELPHTNLDIVLLNVDIGEEEAECLKRQKFSEVLHWMQEKHTLTAVFKKKVGNY